jgi:hypothetical protein
MTGESCFEGIVVGYGLDDLRICDSTAYFSFQGTFVCRLKDNKFKSHFSKVPTTQSILIFCQI